MTDIKKIMLPADKERLEHLKCGEIIEVSGVVYTARDAAHKRFISAIAAGEALPFDFNNAAIYYCGPTPALDGEIIGSCGPTTSARMDGFTVEMLEKGIKVMIGKGKRSREVNEAIKKHKAVYFAAIGGAAALIKSKVIKNDPVAYDDLGCEAVRRLEIAGLKLVVATDSRGETILK